MRISFYIVGFIVTVVLSFVACYGAISLALPHQCVSMANWAHYTPECRAAIDK